MIRRMLAAAQLKSWVYEEVEADRSATFQAMIVVILSALANAGVALSVESESGGFLRMAVGTVLLSILSWALMALIAYLIGTRLFPTQDTKSDWGELARTLGFAQSPAVLRILGLVPVVGPILYAAISIWTVVATVVAIRQALDYESTTRAVLVTIASYIPTAMILALIL